MTIDINHLINRTSGEFQTALKVFHALHPHFFEDPPTMKQIADLLEGLLKDEHETLLIRKEPGGGLHLTWRRRTDDKVSVLKKICAAPRFHLINILTQMMNEIPDG